MTRDGQDLALQSISGGKVDVVWQDDDLHFDDTQEHRVTTLLVSRLGEWWADPTGRRGSRIHEVRRDTKDATRRLQSYAEDALEKAKEEGFIRDVKVWATRQLGGAYILTVQWKTRSGVKRTSSFRT